MAMSETDMGCMLDSGVQDLENGCALNAHTNCHKSCSCGHPELECAISGAGNQISAVHQPERCGLPKLTSLRPCPQPARNHKRTPLNKSVCCTVDLPESPPLQWLVAAQVAVKRRTGVSQVTMEVQVEESSLSNQAAVTARVASNIQQAQPRSVEES